MGGVRQRRGPKVANATTESSNGVKRKKHSKSTSGKSNNKSIPSWIAAIGIIAYLPLIIVFNPKTIPNIFYHLTRRPCEGICSVATQDENKDCGPVDTDRIVFVRIPKTASSTVISLFQKFAASKSVAYVDLQEMEDLISSIPDTGASLNRLGYHDPRPEAFAKRKKNYYKRASQRILYPPFEAQDRTFYEGHLYFFNFTKHALNLVDPEPSYVSMMPDWLIQWYHLKRPTQDQLDHIQQITMVRKPQDRLASMYYYDRHAARSKAWRDRFIGESNRGNATLEECLLDEACVEANELRRWCSVQTEMVCGVRKECTKPISEEGLQTAKENIRNHLLFTGVAERMNESMELLAKLLPTYLEGIEELEKMPNEKQSRVARREQKFSKKAQTILDDICSLDNELYKYADSLLTERLISCSMK